MKRALPLWVAAIVPATLTGHVLVCALSGCDDAHHLWMAPALEISLALLASICATLFASALVRAGIFTHTAAEGSWKDLFVRLAPAQLALFAAIEQSEGGHPSLLGCALQILLALIAAYILYAFAHLLKVCAVGAEAASRYLQRIRHAVTSFVSRQPAPAAYALAIHAGRSRFQRPPPQA